MRLSKAIQERLQRNCCTCDCMGVCPTDHEDDHLNFKCPECGITWKESMTEAYIKQLVALSDKSGREKS